MTEAEATRAVAAILGNLGAGPGDLIYLGIDMGRLPLPTYPAEIDRDSIRERERRWCAPVWDQGIGLDGSRRVEHSRGLH